MLRLIHLTFARSDIKELLWWRSAVVNHWAHGSVLKENHYLSCLYCVLVAVSAHIQLVMQ